MRPILFLLLLTACGSESPPSHSRTFVQTSEYISRKQDEFHFDPLPPTPHPPPSYPWSPSQEKKITKYHFRCKGNLCNPPLIDIQNGQKKYTFDCEGSEQHSLPICNGEEFIYPILIDLLNHVQNKAQAKVIITSGHRCPEHNAYIDPSPQNASSKHLIGAEVSFYVEGYERSPAKVIEWIKEFYSTHPSKRLDKELATFQTYDKNDIPLKTKPILNKEVFIKTYQQNEGRNRDNTHSFPYVSIQVRWDQDKNERVLYSPQQAHHGFYREK